MFLFFSKKNNNDKEIKKIILKQLFNSKTQKKAIMEAARESAKDQNKILLKYRQTVKL